VPASSGLPGEGLERRLRFHSPSGSIERAGLSLTLGALTLLSGWAGSAELSRALRIEFEIADREDRTGSDQLWRDVWPRLGSTPQFSSSAAILPQRRPRNARVVRLR